LALVYTHTLFGSRLYTHTLCLSFIHTLMVSGLDNVQKCLACRGPKRARTAPQPIRKKCFHSRDSQPLFTSVPKGVFRPIMLFLVAAERCTNINQPPGCPITVVDRSAVVLNLFCFCTKCDRKSFNRFCTHNKTF
jgi:hypothetical protein